ncbi:CBASS cGAMP-activated phospholipase [Dyella flagellata]|nr:CBASS cGAMP-activated phospholipase [Dyella flagellata]
MNELSKEGGAGNQSPQSAVKVGGPFQILALSGGGYRGLFCARILADLEQFTGQPTATYFDLIAGTSIGGILALAVAVGVPAETMVRLFETHGEEIFKARINFMNFWRSTYTQERLAELLQSDDVFGQKTLGSCARPVIIPAINYSTGRPVLFKTPHHEDFFRDQNHRLVDVALATSAAPMYFPRHSFNNSQYVDGGLFANAPGMLALHEAHHFLDIGYEQARLVAIGTMSSRFTVNPAKNRQGGMLDWGGILPAATPKKLFGLAISAQEALVHHQLEHLLEEGNYFHLDDVLTDERARAVALDKADKSAREVLLGSADECSKRFLGNEKFREVFNHRATSRIRNVAGNAPTMRSEVQC